MALRCRTARLCIETCNHDIGLKDETSPGNPVMSPRILIVEDDEMLRYLIVDAMSLLDVEVTACSTADEAALLLDRAPPFSVVMTDIWMPGLLSGWDLSNLVQARWPSLPIVISSGHRRVDVSLLPPHISFLPKPWDLDALLAAVENAISHSDISSPSYTNPSPTDLD